MHSVRGVTSIYVSRVAGEGTVAIITEVEGEEIVLHIDEVCYIPGAKFILFSPGLDYR